MVEAEINMMQYDAILACTNIRWKNNFSRHCMALPSRRMFTGNDSLELPEVHWLQHDRRTIPTTQWLTNLDPSMPRFVCHRRI